MRPVFGETHEAAEWSGNFQRHEEFTLVLDRVENQWDANPNYLASTLGRRKARNYPELGLSTTLPIYESFRLHPESVQWVSDPERFTALWRDFQP